MQQYKTITSKDNLFVKQLRKLNTDPSAYKKLGYIWLEGDHLCNAALVRGWCPVAFVVSSSWHSKHPDEWAEYKNRIHHIQSKINIKTDETEIETAFVVSKSKSNSVQCQFVELNDELWLDLSASTSPEKMGCLLQIPKPTTPTFNVPTLILDEVQDAGNVGSILRSAAAFGIRYAIALKGTAALWSPKVLRAGMGAHFGLVCSEDADTQTVLNQLKHQKMPLVVTSSHQGKWLHQAQLPQPCAWVMGHEGRGVSSCFLNAADVHIRIAQPGGEESLNVAAAAAICFYTNSLTLTTSPSL